MASLESKEKDNEGKGRKEKLLTNTSPLPSWGRRKWKHYKTLGVCVLHGFRNSISFLSFVCFYRLVSLWVVWSFSLHLEQLDSKLIILGRLKVVGTLIKV